MKTKLKKDVPLSTYFNDWVDGWEKGKREKSNKQQRRKKRFDWSDF